MVVRTLERLKKCWRFDEIVLAVQPSQRLKVRKLLDRFKIGGVRFVDGGQTRALSVKNAVLSLSPCTDWVLIHDMARPLVSARVVRALVAAASQTGAAISA